MPRELGIPTYYKYTECEVGQQLVSKGEFTGTTEGKFGAQYNFLEVDTGRHVVLNKAGILDHRVEKGDIAEGDVVDIFFEGKQMLENGPYAGKEANNFKILKYSPEELPGHQTRKPVKPQAAVRAPSATTEVLDDLD